MASTKETNEEFPLISGIDDDEGTPTAKKRNIALASLVGALLIGSIVVTHSKSFDTTKTAESSLFQKSPSDILLYKRTNPTANPAKDCEYLASNLGLKCTYAEMTMDGSDAAHDDWCGSRAEAMAGYFNIHQ